MFLFSGFALSYADFSPILKIILFVFGILFPLIIDISFIKSAPKELITLNYEKKFGFSFLFFFLIMAVWFRFFRLTSLASFPLIDEGCWASYTLDLLHHWNGKILIGNDQGIPLALGLSFFFRLLGPSYFSMMVYSGILSAICLPIAYWALRHFFEKNISLVATSFWGIGFWPLFSGRLCLANVLMLPWQLTALGLLGIYLKERKDHRKEYLALGLGIWCGLGFYIYNAWVIVAGLIFLAMTYQSFKNKRSFFSAPIIFFLAISLVLICPMIWSFFQEKNGNYIRSLLGWNGSGENSFSIIYRFICYVKCVFWGGKDHVYYGPAWGGLFNPVGGALFFVGLLECRRQWPLHWFSWVLISLMSPFALGMLTNTIVMCRVSTSMPFLYVVITFGCFALIKTLNGYWVRTITLLSILTISGCLDYQHLLASTKANRWARARTQWQDPIFQNDYWVAEGFLKEQANREGPGLIFTYFNQDLWDHTLTIATYPYNAAINPKFQPGDARWAAFLVEGFEKPFLSERFPKAHWYWLSRGLEVKNGRNLLIVDIPNGMTDKYKDILDAHQSLQRFLYSMMDYQFYAANPVFAEKLLAIEPFFDGDPYLSTFFCHALLEYQNLDNDPSGAMQTMEKAFKLGYPDPLYIYELPFYLTKPQFYANGERLGELAANQYGKAGIHFLKQGDSKAGYIFLDSQARAFGFLGDLWTRMDNRGKASRFYEREYKLTKAVKAFNQGKKE